MKALIVASVASMIDQFNMPNILLLRELGYEVTVAANFNDSGSITKSRAEDVSRRLQEMGVTVVNVPIPRKVCALGAIFKSYRILKKLSRREQYGIMHCHSPIGGAVARLAVKRERKRGVTKTVYTAHGFHFYKGAPKKNWMLYYPVEKLCSRFTDVLVTINKEDHILAENKLHAGRVEYIPGVGVDNRRISSVSVDVAAKKEFFGIPADSPLLLSVGELNENKNHETVVRALASVRDTRVHYAIAGRGALDGHLISLSRELGVEDRVHLLGYREDVYDFYHMADVFVHPSYREGLPVSVIEAMALGLPVVASRIRGNEDLVDEGGGILISPTDTDGFADAIEKLLSDGSLRRRMGGHNKEASKKYSVEVVSEALLEIYKEN
jgi:glycosyltransferase involved in cell wall biosynthesis